MAAEVGRDVFEMEPELVCVGLSPESPDRQEDQEDEKTNQEQEKCKYFSILARRKARGRRGINPLMIPVDDPDGIPGSSSNTTDSGFVDGERPDNHLGFRRQSLHSTASGDEDVFESTECEHTTGSLPIEIPISFPGIQSRTHASSETPGLRGSFPYRAVDSWNNMFCPQLPMSGSARSLSLTLYQWSRQTTSFDVAEERPRSLALSSRRASESHLLRRSVSFGPPSRHSRMRSASGSRIPSPSRSIGTQTPTATGELEFVFPETCTGGRDVTEFRQVTTTVVTVTHAVNGIEGVGQQLRSIADNFDVERSGFFRVRSQSLVQIFSRRRSSAP